MSGISTCWVSSYLSCLESIEEPLDHSGNGIRRVLVLVLVPSSQVRERKAEYKAATPTGALTTKVFREAGNRNRGRGRTRVRVRTRARTKYPALGISIFTMLTSKKCGVPLVTMLAHNWL